MIYKTKNYQIFKKHKNNRNINNLHVIDLIESIKKVNNLKHNPLFVNKKMEILDGQHRLEAAKALNLDIYLTIKGDTGIYGENSFQYYVANNANDPEDPTDLRDIIELNNNNKYWDINNFLQTFIDSGNINYIKFKEFMQNNGIDMATMLILFACTGKAYQKFKDGDFTFPEGPKVLSIEKALSNIRIIQNILFSSNLTKDNGYYKRFKFVQGLIKVSKLENFIWETLIKKIKENLSTVHICHTVGDYAQLFVDIYNYQAKKHKIAL